MNVAAGCTRTECRLGNGLQNCRHAGRQQQHTGVVTRSLTPPFSSFILYIFLHFFDLLFSTGWQQQRYIFSKRNYLNPSIGDKLIAQQGIDEYGTNCPGTLFNPHRWSEDDSYEALVDKHKRAKARQNASRTEIQFVSAKAGASVGAAAGAADASSSADAGSSVAESVAVTVSSSRSVSGSAAAVAKTSVAAESLKARFVNITSGGGGGGGRPFEEAAADAGGSGRQRKRPSQWSNPLNGKR